MMFANKKSKDTILDDRGTYNIDMEVIYGYSENSENIQVVDGFTTVNGLIGFQHWKPESIYLTITDSSGKLNYEVTGTIEWNLMGIVVFYQGKNYSGMIDIE